MEINTSSILPISFKNNDMMSNLLMTILLLQLACCEPINTRDKVHVSPVDAAGPKGKRIIRMVGDIPTPAGYKRLAVQPQSFGAWLRTIPVKADNRVFLFDGTLKSNQLAQYLVLDIPIGKRDLQQCADAIMRLRAQYLLDMGRTNEIRFADNNGKTYAYSDFIGRPFENYLETVFAFCGTLSLQKQLRATQTVHSMSPGDVFIRGGSPGHAVIVIDMAVNTHGEKIFMLAQSYMPAQDVHILRNPYSSDDSPWYRIDGNSLIYTPEWTFGASELRKW